MLVPPCAERGGKRRLIGFADFLGVAVRAHVIKGYGNQPCDHAGAALGKVCLAIGNRDNRLFQNGGHGSITPCRCSSSHPSGSSGASGGGEISAGSGISGNVSGHG